MTFEQHSNHNKIGCLFFLEIAGGYVRNQAEKREGLNALTAI